MQLTLLIIITVIILYGVYRAYRRFSCDVCGVITDKFECHKDNKVCSKKCFKTLFDRQ